MMSDAISKLNREISYRDFIELCFRANKPAILQRSFEDTLPPLWFADQRLTVALSPKSLLSAFGPSLKIPVVESLTVCSCITLDAFLNDYNGSRLLSLMDPVDNANLEPERASMEAAGSHVESVYLKDWHFVHLWRQQHQEQHSACLLPYDLPPMLADDALNAFCDDCANRPEHEEEMTDTVNQQLVQTWLPFGRRGSDYRFVYCGPKGSWTPCHFDVFGSYSWSLNLAGTKLWLFVDYHQLLVNSGATRSLDDMLKFIIESKQIPFDLRCSTLPYAAVVQRPGDLVFVPSLWVHQVHNLSDAVSVNHNWANAYTAPHMVWLLAFEVRQALDALDAETTAILKSDGSWSETLNLMLKGSGAWSIRIMESFLSYLAEWEMQRRTQESDDADELKCRLIRVASAVEALQHLKHSVDV